MVAQRTDDFVRGVGEGEGGREGRALGRHGGGDGGEGPHHAERRSWGGLGSCEKLCTRALGLCELCALGAVVVVAAIGRVDGYGWAIRGVKRGGGEGELCWSRVRLRLRVLRGGKVRTRDF